MLSQFGSVDLAPPGPPGPPPGSPWPPLGPPRTALCASWQLRKFAPFLSRPPPQSPDLRARGRASAGMLTTTMMRMVMMVTMTTDETSHRKTQYCMSWRVPPEEPRRFPTAGSTLIRLEAGDAARFAFLPRWCWCRVVLVLFSSIGVVGADDDRASEERTKTQYYISWGYPRGVA